MRSSESSGKSMASDVPTSRAEMAGRPRTKRICSTFAWALGSVRALSSPARSSAVVTASASGFDTGVSLGRRTLKSKKALSRYRGSHRRPILLRSVSLPSRFRKHGICKEYEIRHLRCILSRGSHRRLTPTGGHFLISIAVRLIGFVLPKTWNLQDT